MRLKSGSIYIHSASEPYNEEQVLSRERVHNWLKYFEMTRHQIHCSGHAKGLDLINLVKEIDAKMLFPIHTEHPELFVRATKRISIVDDGVEYSLPLD